jgi:outer membrane usher protein
MCRHCEGILPRRNGKQRRVYRQVNLIACLMLLSPLAVSANIDAPQGVLDVFDIIAPDAAQSVDDVEALEDPAQAGSISEPEGPVLQAPLQDEPPAAIETCRSAIETVQRMTRQIPPGLLLAIAETESGRSIADDFGPWPWTLNIDGEGRYYDSMAKAVEAAGRAIESDTGNVDLGCMQISETWHGWAFTDLNAMIDPLENASYAASFIMSLHATHGNWRDAIANYHSGNPARGFAYAERVLETWRNTEQGALFIASDTSLSDTTRLAENVDDLRVITDIDREYFLSLVVSEHYRVDTAFVIKDAGGRIYVSLTDLKDVPFADPYSLPLVLYGDVVFVDLSDIETFKVALDEAANSLTINSRGDVFPAQGSYSADIVTPEEISERQPGMHLNYSLAGNLTPSGDFSVSGVLDAVGYWGNKTLRSSVFVDDSLALRRLSTSLTISNYADRAQMIVGDTTTPGGSTWGARHSVLGVSWGTDFSLDPSFFTFPDYSVYGVTDVPAVARFLVDGEVVSETSLEPGPYQFADLPFPDQYGDMTVSVEDVQGQTKYFKVPYIRIPRLYRQGLYSSNYGIGFENKGADTPLGSFGSPIVAMTHRYGFSDTFTGEFHGQLSHGSLGLGVSGDFALLEANRFLSATVAMSLSDLGIGYQTALSFGDIDRTKNSLFSGSVRFSSEDFYLGTNKPSSFSRSDTSRWSARLATSLAGTLPFSINYDFNGTWDGDQSHSFSAGKSWTFANDWHISVSGTHSRDHDGSDSTIFLGLSRSFGKDRPVHTHISSSSSSGSRYVEASIQRPKLPGVGVGYFGRINADVDRGQFVSATVGLESESKISSYSASVQASPDQFSASAVVSGSIGILSGEMFLASDLNSPYLLVRSGAARDLPIQLNYNPLGNTGSDGRLIGDGLVPFSRNRVEFKPEDLGFDFSISEVDYAAKIVPVSLGGYVVDFPIVEQYPATVKLTDGGGVPLPSGALVTNLVTNEVAGVTTDGMVYFENVGDGQKLEANLGRFGVCNTRLEVMADFQKFDEIGPFVCE